MYTLSQYPFPKEPEKKMNVKNRHESISAKYRPLYIAELFLRS